MSNFHKIFTPQSLMTTNPPRWPSDLDVAIVAHNNLATLPAALASLAEAGCPPERITVIDVAATDGTAAWLAAEWPRVPVRRLDRNDGPSPGRNAGIVGASRRFVLLMDADVRVRPDANVRSEEHTSELQSQFHI